MRYILYTFLTIFSATSFAQDKNEAALESIDGIVNELLNQITIEKGEKMDTAAIRKLFRPNALLSVLNNGDSSIIESVSIDEFLKLLIDPYYEEGYLESEIDKVVDEFNGIAQVFQSFYGKHADEVEERGINSYQLAYYKERWWIVSLLWTLESKGMNLPQKYGGNK